MTYRELLGVLEGFTERDLDRDAMVRIADQVIPLAGVYDCDRRCGECPMLDVGPVEGMPAGRA
jgi:hypothetical protein